jgi:hypothetical protein
MCYVVLSTEDPAYSTESDGCPLNCPRLQTYVEQHVREIGPRVVIDQVPHGRTKLAFLPGEAIHLGQALIRLAAMADNDITTPQCDSCEATL